MKAMSMPPSDPRIRQMNDAQWLFCYFNQLEDEKEEAEAAKAKIDYLTWFINYEMAKSVSEHNQANKRSESGNQGPRYQTHDIHRNSEFDREALAASKGYSPDSGLTVDEFLAELEAKKENKEVDFINDSFDDLLASGEFREVVDATQGVGNPNEHIDDFITRALEFEEYLHEHEKGSSFNVPESMKNESVIDDDDLDIFEVDDE